MWKYSESDVDISSECLNNSANVFIGANKDVKDVRCIILDEKIIGNSEVIIGDLSKNDEDVCLFKLLENIEEPLRFKIYYDNKVKREVCQWEPFSSFD